MTLTPFKDRREALTRAESARDFQKNVRPIVDRLEAWRRKSATSTEPKCGERRHP
jgi:hypothetical protein